MKLQNDDTANKGPQRNTTNEMHLKLLKDQLVGGQPVGYLHGTA